MLFERQLFAYDSNGNQLLTTRTTYVDGIPGTPVVTQQNTYDLRNQLIRTVTENGTIVENVYNGDGLRVEKIVNGTATFYLYEYQRVVLEQNSLGDVTGRNVYGTNLLMRTVGVDAFFYMYNAHADVTALLSTSGTIIGTYYYDAFGNILEQTGSAGNSILFAGYQYDKETGMYYLNARMYDPVTARFMQEDTYTGQNMDPLSLNLFTYCHNEPLMYSDPTGHKDAGMSGSMYGMPASVYYNYHQYAKVWESKKTKAQADAAKHYYYAAQGMTESSKKLVLDALLDTEYQDAAYEPIRETTIATLIASDKSSLTLEGIENHTMANILKADLKGQIIDIKSAEPTVWDVVKDVGSSMLYKTGEATVGALKTVGTFFGDMAYANDALNKGNIEDYNSVMDEYIDPIEKKAKQISSDVKYAFSSPERFFSAAYGFGMGCFYTLTGKPIYEMVGSLETYYAGTTNMTDFFEGGYSGLDNYLIDIYGMDEKGYNIGVPVGETTMSVAMTVQSISDAKAAKAAAKAAKVDPASTAKGWQGNGDYPGVDDWSNMPVKKGTKVWGGEPGQSNFYTTEDVMKTVGNDATKLNQGLQVGKGSYPQFRPGMTQYEVLEDITVGFSKALANPQYGPGGFDQLFIPNFENVLKPILSRTMTNR